MVYICTKFHKDILDGICRADSKGHNSIKNVGGDLVLCTSSDDGLYLYKVS